jgi:hypothetical protein
VEWASEERKAIPMHTEPAAVLAAVKDKPKRAAPRGAVLDRRCARRPTVVQGRDGRMGCQAEQKNGKRKSEKAPLLKICA